MNIKALLMGKRGDSEVEANINKQGNLYVVQGDLPYLEITKRGNGWQAMSTTAVAGLVVRPV